MNTILLNSKWGRHVLKKLMKPNQKIKPSNDIKRLDITWPYDPWIRSHDLPYFLYTYTLFINISRAIDGILFVGIPWKWYKVHKQDNKEKSYKSYERKKEFLLMVSICVDVLLSPLPMVPQADSSFVPVRFITLTLCSWTLLWMSRLRSLTSFSRTEPRSGCPRRAGPSYPSRTWAATAYLDLWVSVTLSYLYIYIVF